MTISAGGLFFCSLVYLLALFAVAFAAERRWLPPAIARHPLTYILSLGVYATTWSFYGSVGFAESNGFLFLAVYLGLTLAFVLALLLSLVLTILTPWGWMGLVGLVGVYTLANLAASLLTASRAGWRYFLPLPLAFATIHLSYGLGFLVGLFRFAGGW